jgi:transcriptional regulator
MYIPKHFEETRIEVLHELMRMHSLAALVVLTSNGLDANHIPFEIDPDPAPFGTLRGHIARANPLWLDHSPDVNCLVIFQGPSVYISPSWYLTKAETGKVVPTWNYAVVHAYGALRIVQDRGWLRQLVERLTDRHEAERSDPWKVTDAPSDFIDGMLDSIVGIEIPITRLIGKWKVSQNRPARDRNGVVEGLGLENSDSARAMRELVHRQQKVELTKDEIQKENPA